MKARRLVDEEFFASSGVERPPGNSYFSMARRDEHLDICPRGRDGPAPLLRHRRTPRADKGEARSEHEAPGTSH